MYGVHARIVGNMPKRDAGKSDKVYLNMRLGPRIRQRLEMLCEFNDSTVSEEVRLAILCRLREFGLWPKSAEAEDTQLPE